ncbi:serine hydrolase [Streptomyces sp. WAC00469]|uniref:serine hydrolase n=2 Tax=Streptomyces TaxID=1883 RepID=UPI000F73FED4|nr:serine hydrolase [Streptomyces sp. WAC00469]RSS06738.1 hypothetical protein EF917_07935 [Streptomyces sp. WAC00469]
MPYPSTPAPVQSVARRPAACAGVLLTAALVLLGALQAPPAAADPGTPRAAAATAHPHGTPRVTAAVLDLDGDTREPLVRGDDTPYDTASIVKLDILAALLLRAQDAGRPLTARERSLAEPMIEHSDNAAANVLWCRIGGAPGLEAANRRLGLRATEGGPGRRWGLTRTTASDQIRLLRAVFDDRAPGGGAPALHPGSRRYIRTLMSRVAPEQTWGVSAASGSATALPGSATALPGSATALKNGWLRRSTTGLWDVNSVGRVTAGGHRYLVAVLSDGSATMDEGVAAVERTARAAVASAARA